ncbi:MAG TPA: decarboxylating 6-phosphogluconate dehydrogenase [Candidatus Babeliales bacterium]|nr:decarboxylating 6-phosphogluconate dehydrogenase [Candidatus Babeliales bacterium]
MKIGVVGLGRMGAAIVERLCARNYHVLVYDLDPVAVRAVEKFGTTSAGSIEELAMQVDLVWLMVPAGDLIDQILARIIPVLKLKSNPIIIDGGNSNFKDSIRRAKLCAAQQISFLDCGTSCGLHGRDLGFCLMVGGDQVTYTKIEKYLAAIAMPKGYALVGPSGAGHYVKMVHNGIEYALLQAYAEGFDLLRNNQNYPELDLAQVAGLWQHGSIIRSWLLELTQQILVQDQELKNISGQIGGGSTGSWTVAEAEAQKIAVPLIKLSLELRQKSNQAECSNSYTNKLVALLRHQFGGHSYKKNNIN